MRVSFRWLMCVLLGTSALGARSQTMWVGSWAASAQLPDASNTVPVADLTDATLRQVVRLSVGGKQLRLRLSNEFGTEALRVEAVHVARPAGPGRVDAASDVAVTFDGQGAVVIPPGAAYVSDAISVAAASLSDVSVTLYLPKTPVGETCHPGSRATSYMTHGEHSAAGELPAAKTMTKWCVIAGIDVTAERGAAAMVALGDSITDGHGATTDGNDRWTDVLARRLQADKAGRGVAVLNEGIGGNHLLTDGIGVNALARLDRDVLGQTGVRWVMVFEGINDLGALSRMGETTPAQHAELVGRMIGAYRQIIERGHAHGMKVIGATITPDVGSDYYHPAAANEADRVQVNAWIREPGHFDGVVDFDKVTADPAHPERLRTEFDSGDHLHPGPAGYKAMGEAVALSLFR